MAEQAATCRRRRRSRQKSLPMAGELEANLQQQQQVPQPLAQQHTVSSKSQKDIFCFHEFFIKLPSRYFTKVFEMTIYSRQLFLLGKIAIYYLFFS